MALYTVSTGTIFQAQDVDQIVNWLSHNVVTVSPKGLAGGATTANDGADYGPDTPSTTTCGIQEALNSLPSCSVYDGGSFLVSGQTGKLVLRPGLFQTTGTITVPPGAIVMQGAGSSAWIPDMQPSGPTQYLGGTVITSTAPQSGASVFSVPQDSHTEPATALILRDLDIWGASPALPGTSSTPAIASLPGWLRGEMSNVTVLEVKSGGIGTNVYKVLDISPGSGKDITIMRNVSGYGGNFAVWIRGSHMHCSNISGGSTSASIVGGGFDVAVTIEQDLDVFFSNVHCFASGYGLSFIPYGFGQPYLPLVIHGLHVESCTHYIITDSFIPPGTLIVECPIWDSTPSPASDIATMLSNTGNTPSISAGTGVSILTRYEYDPTSLGVGRHVTVAKGAWTAGTSPYTFTPLPYDSVFVLTTVGGITALTLDGQALFNGTFSIGQQVYVGQGHSLVATWSTTAPIFEILPL